MNFFKLAKSVPTSKAPKAADLNNPGLPGALADYVPFGEFHNIRAGRAQAMADATGQRTSSSLRNPGTTDFVTSLGSAAAGAGLGLGGAYLAGQPLNSDTAGTAAAVGGTAAGLLSIVLSRHFRRKEMQRIGKSYDAAPTKNPGMPRHSFLGFVAGGASEGGRASAAKEIAGDPFIPFDGTAPTQVNRSIDSGKLRELPA